MQVIHTTQTGLESYFEQFRCHVIGIQQTYESPYGRQRIVYADWTASGRLYQPIEDILTQEISPFVANTHTETSMTGATMTAAYHNALQMIKKHVNAAPTDVIISTASGMTGVVNKLQRMLGLRIHERFASQVQIPDNERPIVFITHMEHHSNQTSWLETIAEVQIIRANDEGLPDLEVLAELLDIYKDRPLKIAAVTSCSNVTGVFTPYHQIAEIMHQHGGYCFVDFACSAPYINIDMHPNNPDQRLDAIYFSPHKFLGGPGSTGILVFNSALYNNRIPDTPGGGTVAWTNPWGQHRYVDDIEAREDGGTPAFMQTIRAALCVRLKEQMSVERILAREHELMAIFWERLGNISNLTILADHLKNRLGIVSFYIHNVHYNLIVRLLSDRFGIQVRGGCSCAGTYGHYLLNVTKETSKNITDQIDMGCLLQKPGWVRMSIHPTMSNKEAEYIAHAIAQVAHYHQEWMRDYFYDATNNDYKHHSAPKTEYNLAAKWFEQSLS